MCFRLLGWILGRCSTDVLNTQGQGCLLLTSFVLDSRPMPSRFLQEASCSHIAQGMKGILLPGIRRGQHVPKDAELRGEESGKTLGNYAPLCWTAMAPTQTRTEWCQDCVWRGIQLSLLVALKIIDPEALWLCMCVFACAHVRVCPVVVSAAAAKPLQLCPTLRDPMDCSPPGSSVHGIFQARVLEWGAIAFLWHLANAWGLGGPH